MTKIDESRESFEKEYPPSKPYIFRDGDYVVNAADDDLPAWQAVIAYNNLWRVWQRAWSARDGHGAAVGADMVLVPRGLIGAACSAIDKQRDAPKVLEQLRRYTFGDLSQAPSAAENPDESRRGDAEWHKVTPEFLSAQPEWLHGWLWVCTGGDDDVYSAKYEWQQGRNPDRLKSRELGDVHAMGYYVAPQFRPQAKVEL